MTDKPEPPEEIYYDIEYGLTWKPSELPRHGLPDENWSTYYRKDLHTAKRVRDIEEKLYHLYHMVNDIIQSSDGVILRGDAGDYFEKHRREDGVIPWELFLSTCWLGCMEGLREHLEGQGYEFKQNS